MQVFKRVFNFLFDWGLGVFFVMYMMEISALLILRQVLFVELFIFTEVILIMSVLA